MENLEMTSLSASQSSCHSNSSMRGWEDGSSGGCTDCVECSWPQEKNVCMFTLSLPTTFSDIQGQWNIVHKIIFSLYT